MKSKTKKGVSMLLLLLIVCGAVFTVAPLTATAAAEDEMFTDVEGFSSDSEITRVEWIHELVGLFDMTVEQNNMPDDYFYDIETSSPYFRDVMVATEFGVVDIEAGYSFYPEMPVTREFAAQTMNYCLGFEPDENAVYPFTDVEDITYPDHALIAVQRGWFSLSAGKFLPEENVTLAEMDAIFADAAIVWSATEIEEEYDNTYVYESGVVEIPAWVVASEDENGVVTIVDSPKTISNGQTFVVYYNGLPQAYIARSVTVSGSLTTIATDEKDVEELTLEADAQGIAEADLSLAEPIDDTIVTFIPDEISLYASGSVRIPGSLEFKKDIPLVNGGKISVSGKISKMVVNYKFKTKDSYSYIGIKGETDYKVSGSFNFLEAGGHLTRIELVKIPVAGIGKVTVSMEYSISGSISFVYTADTSVGLEFSKSGGFRVVSEFKKKSFSLNTELKLTAGLELALGFDTIALKGNLYAKAGAELKQTTKEYNDGNLPNTCIHQAGFLYAKVGATASIDVIIFKDTVTYSIDVLTEKNSPVRIVNHFEDNHPVLNCTRDKSAFYGNGYSTTTNSRYRNDSNGYSISGNWREESGTAVPVYTYTVSNNQATITGYSGTASALLIPSELDGYPVVAIGSMAFRNKTALRSVVIPDSVTSIGSNAFDGCTNLSSVTLSKSLDSLGYNSFRNAAITSIEIPKSLTTASSLSGGPFSNCSQLKNVTFEIGATRVAQYLFAYCTGIESIIIPDSVTTINSYAFQNCTALQNVILSDKLTAIATNAFQNCTALGSIIIPGSVTSIGTYAFDGCTSLSSAVLPNSLITVPNEAFRNCANLTDIILPSTLSAIQQYAFYGCESLPAINLPDGLQTIGNYAFYGAKTLKEITIPSSVTSIGASAFYNCDALETATINASGSIGSQAFYDCDALTTLYLADTVTSIGSQMCYGNDSLATVTLGQYITTIPDSAFRLCPALVSITLPMSCTTVAANAFAESTGLTDVYIPPSVTSIQTNSFSYPARMTIYGKSGSYAKTYADSRSITFVPTDAEITSLSFRDSEIYVDRSKTFFLPLIIEPAFNADTITFSSSNTTVATVNATTGSVNTRAYGTAVITATNGVLSATCTLNVQAITTVTSVSITPQTATVSRGGTQTFSAAVAGTNNPPQTVTWTVEGASGSTSVNADGELSVGSDETAATLTVKATSTFDATKSGMSIVTVSKGSEMPLSGDVSGDSKINMQDVLLIYQNFRGKVDFTDEQIQAADVNGDGEVNMVDVLMVYQYFRGMITEFPAS